MPIIDNLIYGYVPSLPWNATLLSLFAASMLVHCYQAFRSRYWIIFPTLILGALIEVMGYAARVWSSQDVYELNGFLMQICLLIMAPVFFSAYCYVVLGTAIHSLDERYSVLPSGLYFAIFITADIISLILQAVGGGQAASSASDAAPTTTATSIMVAGIIFQLVSMAIFIACALDFAWRVVCHKPYAFRERQIARREEKKAAKAREAGRAQEEGTSTPASETTIAPAVSAEKMAIDGTTELTAESRKKWTLILASVLVSSAMILTRGVFRSIELSNGWSGYLVETEIYMMVLDGIPMVIAVGVFNLLHPGMILGKKASWRGYY